MVVNDYSYFEPEVKDGFYVPSIMKRAWAAEMEVLAEVDRICRKYDITYFADWGSLLATIRHKGFIPWDDDLDIVMKRADYERFMEIAPKELPEGFAAYNYKNHDDFWLFLARVVGKQRICFEEEHLERFCQFPYIAGVDIFVLDYVARDKEQEKKRDELALYTLVIADSFEENNLSKVAQEEGLARIEREAGVCIDRSLKGSDMRRALYGVVEKLFSRFTEEESDELTQLFPFGMKNENFRFPKKYYEQAVYMPYEMMSIPVPVCYNELLKKRYGDYLKLIRSVSGHDYPYFETQHKQLLSVLDFKIPTYQFKKEQLREYCVAADNETVGYKSLLKESYARLQTLQQMIVSALQEGNGDVYFGALEESQQLAIDMGTLIEAVKGEGLESVSCLEKYCETLYLSSRQQAGAVDQLLCDLKQLWQVMSAEILDRKTVVFLPYKANQWEAIASQWKRAKEDGKSDVYVMPIPYYYKKYDGSVMESYYEGALFDDELAIVDYRKVDLALLRPDEIYIQNPYDEWDAVISVAPEYYSSVLQQQCDKLIYKIPFEVEEFDRDSERAYFNMRYYCTVPGVVRADQVIVQSKQIKQMYIEKLVEFAGSDTRELWEKKLVVEVKMAKEENVTASTDLLSTANRKCIVYGHSACCLMEQGEQYLEKMQYAYRIFKENADRITVIFREHPMTADFTRNTNPKLLQQYEDLLATMQDEPWARPATDMTDAELAESADAYYGDGDRLVLEFTQRKKPVMIQEVSIR